MIGGVLAAAALGVVVSRLIMQPLRDASPLTRLVATLGVLTAISGAAGLLLGNESTRFVSPIFPAHQVSVLGAHVGVDRLYMLLIAVVLTAGLAAIYRYTKFGHETFNAFGLAAPVVVGVPFSARVTMSARCARASLTLK